MGANTDGFDVSGSNVSILKRLVRLVLNVSYGMKLIWRLRGSQYCAQPGQYYIVSGIFVFLTDDLGLAG